MIDDEYDWNAFAQTGWIAAHFFVEGLRRVDENGDDLTRLNFMDAMEQAPISNPFGGELDFGNGSRLGTDSMALIQYDPATLDGGIGWVPSYDFASISDIIGE
jgi:ABC-type branched-subunit amino acid transport system substrate-binding protein